VSLLIRPYDAALQADWDDFVRTSKNGTFLFLRGYMEYHRERFADCSLLIFDRRRLVALLPANRNGDQAHSHAGLTYGGLLTSRTMTTPLLLDAFDALLEHLRGVGLRTLFYKTIPTIYHIVPAEEDRYALFLAGAALHRRDVLSVVAKASAVPVQARRRRGAEKAARLGVTAGKSQNWAGFWPLLTRNLDARFGIAPVHSLAEMQGLCGRFPEHVGLHLASLGREILAGVVVYESARVAHAQYIAASENGRETGALDLLFLHLLQTTFANKCFFDFGISNEQQGRVLNRGLIEQKEGFGARAVAHDFYRLDL
jgi:hypothetical protein